MTKTETKTTQEHFYPTPHNPRIFRMGKVERRFQSLAEKAGMPPGEFLRKLIQDGVTQTELSEKLLCTRQAVAVLAGRYGLEFPGARIDIDEAVQQTSTCLNLEQFLTVFWGQMTQEEMASHLGVSLSTLKRRIREMGKAT